MSDPTNNNGPVRPGQQPNQGVPVPVPGSQNLISEQNTVAGVSNNSDYKIPEVVEETYRAQAPATPSYSAPHDEGHLASVAVKNEKPNNPFKTVGFVLAGVALMGVVTLIGINIPNFFQTTKTVSTQAASVPSTPAGKSVSASYTAMNENGIKEYNVYSYGDASNTGGYATTYLSNPKTSTAISCAEKCDKNKPTIINFEDNSINYIPAHLYKEFIKYQTVQNQDGSLLFTNMDPKSTIKTITLTVDKNNLIVSAKVVEKDGVKWESTINYGLDSASQNIFNQVG